MNFTNKFFGLLPVILIFILVGCQKDKNTQIAKPLAPIIVRASVDKATCTVGDLVEYKIKVDAETNVLFNIPMFSEEVGGFAIRNFGISPRITNDFGRIEQSHFYSLETYLTGEYELPETAITYYIGDSSNQIKSTSIFIEVSSVAGENELSEDIRDIKGPLTPIAEKEKADIRRLLLKIFIVLALLLLLLKLIFRRKKKIAVTIPKKPAHEIAYADLKKLDKMHLIEQGLFKEYYYRLSIVFRQYIENKFAIKAPEQTTEEFLIDLKDNPLFKSEQRAIMREFLNESDLIKFANYSSSDEDAHKASEIVVTFIEETCAKTNQEDKQL